MMVVYTIFYFFYLTVYIDSSNNSVDFLRLQNTGTIPRAFRIRVSVPNVLIIKPSEGILEPSQIIEVPVALKSIPAVTPDNPLAKLSVEFAESDDDYYVMGSKAFWETNGKTVLKQTVVVNFNSIKVADIEPVLSLRAIEEVDVIPDVLKFQGCNTIISSMMM